jgi:hypothetical protein
MTDSLDASASPKPRSAAACPPIRLRATITIDLEAEDYVTAEQLKARMASEYDLLRRVFPAAELGFRQRKPRNVPRVPAPELVVRPYVDD